jgi:hypothetical protein
MIVERITWKVSYSHQNEFIELLKATVEAMGFTPCVCTYRFGAADIVTSDLEFETFLDREKYWEDFDYNAPEHVAFHERLPDLATTAKHELLIVH